MNTSQLKKIINFIRKIYKIPTDFIPLHAPVFEGNEKKYLLDCIDSTFVSSIGEFVNRIEKELAEYSGSRYAIATVNGTAALHVSLLLSGVQSGDEIITQPLTFIATTNAISYCNAKPIFLDVDKDTMGLSPESVALFLHQFGEIRNNGFCYNKYTGKRIIACVPMHTFGHSCKIKKIVEICSKYNISVVEDSAESIGSTYNGKMTGTFGKFGIYSFNGNKTITSGGGGIIVTDDENLASKAKHITTTAKIPHKWEYQHDLIGYNYRMPNINAALAYAQLEQLNVFIDKKRKLAEEYNVFFDSIGVEFFNEPKESKSNYWLNSVILNDKQERDFFLKETNKSGVMTRPIWALMNKLEMFKDCQTDSLENAQWLEDRVINIPSSVIQCNNI
jgi:perosamine synthetase